MTAADIRKKWSEVRTAMLDVMRRCEEGGNDGADVWEATELDAYRERLVREYAAERAKRVTMTNAVPPLLSRAVNRILTDRAAKGWRDGCTEFALRYPRYLTVLRGGKLSDQPNFYHILGAVLKCGYPEVTDDNWPAVLAALAQRAKPLHEAENVLE